jgi:hypothetical protein
VSSPFNKISHGLRVRAPTGGRKAELPVEKAARSYRRWRKVRVPLLRRRMSKYPGSFFMKGRVSHTLK